MKQLNAKEVEIIKYIARGYTAKAIAKAFDLEFRTIESYIARIKKKLGAKNVTNAVYIAYDQSVWNHASI